MWGMYGPTYRPEDNEYLSEISKVSRDWAAQVFEQEYGKQNAVRRWLFDVIEEAAWGWSLHKDCSCALCSPLVSDPVIRVEAVGTLAKQLIQEECDAQDLDPMSYCLNTETEAMAVKILQSPGLAAMLPDLISRRERELAGRRAYYAKEAERAYEG